MSPSPSRLETGARPREAGTEGAVGANKHGLLLFAHGARDAGWAAPFEAVAAQVRAASPATPLALAYLEFMAPDLVGAGTLLADAGCTAIDVVPLFLGAGGHVRKDVPALLQRLRGMRPQLAVTLRDAIGADPRVVDAMAQAVLRPAASR